MINGDIKIHLPLNKLGLCLGCDSFYGATKCMALLYNQLLASVLEEESLSCTTQSSAEQPPCQRSRGASILTGAAWGLYPSLPPEVAAPSCHVPILQFHFWQSEWMGAPKQLG